MQVAIRNDEEECHMWSPKSLKILSHPDMRLINLNQSSLEETTYWYLIEQFMNLF